MSLIGKGSACPSRSKFMAESWEDVPLASSRYTRSRSSFEGNNNMQHTFDSPVRVTISPYAGCRPGNGQYKINVDVEPRPQCGRSNSPICNSPSHTCSNSPEQNKCVTACFGSSPFNPLTLPNITQFCDQIHGCPNAKFGQMDSIKDCFSQDPVCTPPDPYLPQNNFVPQFERGAPPLFSSGIQSIPPVNQTPANNNQPLVPASPSIPTPQPAMPNACHAFLSPPPPMPQCRPPTIFGPLVSNDPNCPMPPGQYVLVHPCCMCCMEKGGPGAAAEVKEEPKPPKEKTGKKGGKKGKGRKKRKKQKGKHNSSPEPPNVPSVPRLKQLRQLFIDQDKLQNWGNSEDWSYLDKVDNGLSYMHSICSSSCSDDSDPRSDSINDAVLSPLFPPQMIRRANSYTRHQSRSLKQTSLNREHKRGSSGGKGLLYDLAYNRVDRHKA